MPIYEYQCQKCGARSEELQGINASPLETCEECGGELRKLISAPAFQFKGTGWYVTDYARKGSAEKEGGGKESGGKESGGKESGGKDKAKADTGKTSSSESKPSSGDAKASSGKAKSGSSD